MEQQVGRGGNLAGIPVEAQDVEYSYATWSEDGFGSTIAKTTMQFMMIKLFQDYFWDVEFVESSQKSSLFSIISPLSTGRKDHPGDQLQRVPCRGYNSPCVGHERFDTESVHHCLRCLAERQAKKDAEKWIKWIPYYGDL